MPKTYERAPDSVQELATPIIEKFHADLKAAGVTIDYMFAKNDSGDAVTLGGYACNAVVKILGLKERVKGQADAEIVIDEEHWNGMTEKTQIALLDHELYHLTVVKDDTGSIKRDDTNRPRLKMRKHDYQFGWFAEIARRHTTDAIEVQQAKSLWDEQGQYFFCFLNSADLISAGQAAKVEAVKPDAPKPKGRGKKKPAEEPVELKAVA